MGGFKDNVNNAPCQIRFDDNSQHILFLVSKYLNVYDFHNFLMLSKRTFRTLRDYLEETGLKFDIQIFSGADEPLFQHFSAYCSRLSTVSERKIVHWDKIYALREFTDSRGLLHKEIHVKLDNVFVNDIRVFKILPSKILRVQTESRFNSFPIYAFTFEENVFELGSFELLEEKDLLRATYTNVYAYSATMDYPFTKLKEMVEKPEAKIDFGCEQVQFVLTIFCNKRTNLSTSDPEEVLFYLAPNDYRPPFLVEPIILSHNTCRNLFERKKRKNLKKRMHNCLPGFRNFFRK